MRCPQYKKILITALTVCFMASVLCIPALASQSGSAEAVNEPFYEKYIMLGITALALIGTVVSAIVLSIDRKKEKEAAKKAIEKEKETQKSE